jgi:2-phospho-L-lactate/phosphoenolpyruvate guanylyltransferase
MSTLAILPVKSFGAAKQRLAPTLGAGFRQALARAMFSDVLASLRRVPSLDAVVVTADPLAESAAVGVGVRVLRDSEQGGQSPAAQIGIRYARACEYERVLLVPGDTPLVEPAEVTALLRRGDEEELGALAVPDRHGTGTNALLLHPPDAIAPSFGPGSFERHAQAARAGGLAYGVAQVPGLVLDVDTPDDLAELTRVLESRRGHSPSTRGALSQLDRSRGQRQSPVPA